MVELIEFAVAVFGPVTELMFADRIGNDVGKVQGQVTSSLGGSQTDLLKSPGTTLGGRRDDDIGSAVNGLPVVRGVGAQEYAHGLRIEAVVVVMEELVKVAGTKKELVGPPR